VIDPATKTVTTQRTKTANLAIIPLADENLTVNMITGQMKPFVQGWLPTAKSATDTGVRPCAYFSRNAKGPVHFLYVLAPYRLNQSPPVVSVSHTDGAGLLNAVIALAKGGKVSVSLATTEEWIVDGVAGRTLRLAAG